MFHWGEERTETRSFKDAEQYSAVLSPGSYSMGNEILYRGGSAT